MTVALESSTIRKASMRLVPLLFAMVFFSYLDRINIGFAELRMGKDLGITPGVFGFAGSIFFLGYMLLEVPSNLALDRFGARRWIARIMLTWGVVAAATAFAVGGTSLYALRFLLGVMEAGLLPGLAVYATHWFPSRYRARAVSGYIIGSSVAPVVGGPLSTAIMTYLDDVAGLHGWQWMFLIEGLGASLLGLLALRVMTEGPADASWLDDDEKAWLEKTLAAERSELGEHQSFRQVAADSRVWSLAAMFGCALVGIYGLQLWLPQIIKELGDLTDLQVGFLSAVPPLLGIVGAVVAGRSSDRTGDRKWHLTVAYALSAVAIVGSALVGRPVLGFVLLCLTGLFIYAGNPLFWALGSSLRAGVAGAATVALINTIAQFGGLIGPWSIGLVRGSTGGFTVALLVIGAFLVIAAIIAALLRVRPVADRVAPVAGPQVRERPA